MNDEYLASLTIEELRDYLYPAKLEAKDLLL
jgi:hypothetical protein